MMRNPSPITVQQWVDMIPPATPAPSALPAYIVCPSPSKFPKRNFARDISMQSDDASSHCSSVESVLESRKPDPEAVLLGLGFGPPYSSNNHSRIPQRFLQPSKLLTTIDLNRFLEDQGEQQYSSVPPSPARPKPKTF